MRILHASSSPHPVLISHRCVTLSLFYTLVKQRLHVHQGQKQDIISYKLYKCIDVLLQRVLLVNYASPLSLITVLFVLENDPTSSFYEGIGVCADIGTESKNQSSALGK